MAKHNEKKKLSNRGKINWKVFFFRTKSIRRKKDRGKLGGKKKKLAGVRGDKGFDLPLFYILIINQERQKRFGLYRLIHC